MAKKQRERVQKKLFEIRSSGSANDKLTTVSGKLFVRIERHNGTGKKATTRVDRIFVDFSVKIGDGDKFHVCAGQLFVNT